MQIMAWHWNCVCLCVFVSILIMHSYTKVEATYILVTWRLTLIIMLIRLRPVLFTDRSIGLLCFIGCLQFKGAWHENSQKLTLLKLADKVCFHLNISSTMKKLQTCISFRSRPNRRKLCLCYLLFVNVIWENPSHVAKDETAR